MKEEILEDRSSRRNSFFNRISVHNESPSRLPPNREAVEKFGTTKTIPLSPRSSVMEREVRLSFAENVSNPGSLLKGAETSKSDGILTTLPCKSNSRLRPHVNILDKTLQDRVKQLNLKRNDLFSILFIAIQLFYLALIVITDIFLTFSSGILTSTSGSTINTGTSTQATLGFNLIGTSLIVQAILFTATLIQIIRLLDQMLDRDTSKWVVLAIYFFLYNLILIFASSETSVLILIFGSIFGWSYLIQTSFGRCFFELNFAYTAFTLSFLIKSNFFSNCLFYEYCFNNQANQMLARDQLFWVAMNFIILQALIRMDKASHVEQKEFTDMETTIKSLAAANLDLQNQLRVANIRPETDITAPLTRATEILLSFRQKLNALDDIDTKKAVEQALSILNSDKLFEPEFLKDTGDNDVTNFLQAVLNTSNASKFKTSTTAAQIKPNHNGDRDDANPDLALLLDNISLPFFDVMQLEVVSEGHALYHISTTIFREFEFDRILNIREVNFCKWVLKMESGYNRSNYYHNSSHAADVTQVMHYFISRPKLRKLLTAEDLIATIIAAIGHDYMHPGFTNAFLIATRNQLAMRYNDTSVLENFHAASVSELFTQPEYDMFAQATAEQKRYIKELIISMIMATDMSFHFEWLGKFKNKIATNSLNFDNLSDKKLVLNIAIKCSDINNLSKPLEISRMWTQLIIAEFYKQGDEEKARGLPVSMFMDRNSTDIPKSQIGFIDYIILPLYEAWAQFLENEIDGHLENLIGNKQFWKNLSEKGEPVNNVEIPKFNISVLTIKVPKVISSPRKKHSDDFRSSVAAVGKILRRESLGYQRRSGSDLSDGLKSEHSNKSELDLKSGTRSGNSGLVEADIAISRKNLSKSESELFIE